MSTLTTAKKSVVKDNLILFSLHDVTEAGSNEAVSYIDNRIVNWVRTPADVVRQSEERIFVEIRRAKSGNKSVYIVRASMIMCQELVSVLRAIIGVPGRTLTSLGRD